MCITQPRQGTSYIPGTFQRTLLHNPAIWLSDKVAAMRHATELESLYNHEHHVCNDNCHARPSTRIVSQPFLQQCSSVGSPALLVDVLPQVAQGRRMAALCFLRFLCHILQLRTSLKSGHLRAGNKLSADRFAYVHCVYSYIMSTPKTRHIGKNLIICYNSHATVSRETKNMFSADS